MSEREMFDRTPVVTVELQLRPQPPKGATPWFWGGGMLDFHQHHGRDVEVVWRAELPSFWTMRSARVEHGKEFGWVLVVRLTHWEAKSLLARHGWPDYVVGNELGALPSAAVHKASPLFARSRH